jgi:multidrug efflux pump subunit AcrA (membrane-fusion protein)
MLQIFKSVSRHFAAQLRRHPVISFCLSFTGVMALIIGGYFWRQVPAPEAVAAEQPLAVTIFDPSALYLTTMAKVDNQGVVNVVVQNPSGGVVQRVNVKPGQKISRGQQLVSLSTNYQGGNVSALQLQLAEKNWLLTHANYWDQQQVDEIGSDLNRVNAHHGEELSASAYTTYELQQGLKASEIGADITDRLQQLNLDSAENQYFQAQIAASLMYPASPIAGTIEKVNLSLGQVVAAGQVVATVRADNQPVRLVVAVGEAIVARLNPLMPAKLIVDEATYLVELDYLPTTPGVAGDYELSFTLSKELGQLLTPNAYLPLQLPLLPPTGKQILIPLNAVYQTQDQAYAYVLGRSQLTGEAIAEQKVLTLGTVVGEYVVVADGLASTDRVIIHAKLLDGQKIEVKE